MFLNGLDPKVSKNLCPGKNVSLKTTILQMNNNQQIIKCMQQQASIQVLLCQLNFTWRKPILCQRFSKIFPRAVPTPSAIYLNFCSCEQLLYSLCALYCETILFVRGFSKSDTVGPPFRHNWDNCAFSALILSEEIYIKTWKKFILMDFVTPILLLFLLIFGGQLCSKFWNYGFHNFGALGDIV